MKWFRVLIAIFLLAGMLLCINSVAYADDPPDDDSNLKVDITVVGDNADVNVDVPGQDSKVTVNTGGTEIYLNGQNINEPTVINRTTTSIRTIDKTARQLVNELDLLLKEYGSALNLTANGLAKVIIQVQGQESTLNDMSQILDENTARLDDLVDGQVAGLNDQFSDLSGRIYDLERENNALATEVEEERAAMQERLDKMELDYNKKLVIMGVVFSFVLLGLGMGLTRRIHRIRKMID